MKASRLLVFLAVATAAATLPAADTIAQGTGTRSTPTAATSNADRTDLRALDRSLRSSSQLGLKLQSERARSGIDLPFGLNYNPDQQSLLVPIDPKNEWGFGFHFDLTPPRPIELAPPTSPLGLQPKRAPGVMLQKRF